LKTAIETDRSKRFQDAGELAKALEQGLSQANLRMADEPPPAALTGGLRISPVHLWQLATLICAAAFAITLTLLLRR
jgi:hypothetical protein